MRLTQKHKIIQHCIKASDSSISSREALIDHGVTCLHKRIAELQNDGYPFTRQRKVNPATKQRYTRYTLTGLPQHHHFGLGRDLQNAKGSKS